MEEKREADVWQRVTARPEPARDLESLIRESAELEAVYRRTVEKLTGRQQHLAKELLEAERSIREALAGIGRLTGQLRETVRVWQPGMGDGIRLLGSCYHRTRRCQAEYLARSLEPEYGEVYRQLAELAGRNCLNLVRLLGARQKR